MWSFKFYGNIDSPFFLNYYYVRNVSFFFWLIYSFSDSDSFYYYSCLDQGIDIASLGNEFLITCWHSSLSNNRETIGSLDIFLNFGIKISEDPSDFISSLILSIILASKIFLLGFFSPSLVAYYVLFAWDIKITIIYET